GENQIYSRKPPTAEGTLMTATEGALLPPISIMPATNVKIPGRWDPKYAQKFKEDVRRLDGVPGIVISEYVRESKLREQLKLLVFDLKGREKELGPQLADLKRDVGNFKEMKESLRESLRASAGDKRQELRAELKQVRAALANATYSMKSLSKELASLMMDVRKNMEFMAALPIVHMLNITAQESTIPFEKGRAMVPESAYPTLDSIAEAAKEMKPFRIVVEGHSDQSGSNWANTRLSKQRADAVAQYLRTKTALPRTLFVTKGMGSTRPLEEGDSPEVMARNRRVEIWFELRGL
ncbi:MAG: OmpA family protein, partial [Elusimicrobia bacterium]|nr:OmpA family protein [Candidatus Obscuribacterium magneticum]MCB4755888.1 OmpA family protein [Candidatus Obscuribacterium magneticum]